jgi:integrase
MLTNTQIKGFKPQVKLYRNADSHGLALEVATSGSKIWIHRYRFNKKATMMTLGHYPEMSLLDARQARDANKQLLKKLINPKAKRQAASNKRLFKDMFIEWHETQKGGWTPGYAEDVLSRAQNHVFAHIGDMYVDTIETEDVIRMLKIIEDKDALDTLKKMKSIIKRVFQYCIIHKVSSIDPTSVFNHETFASKKHTNYASLTKDDDVAGLLRMLDNYHGSHEVGRALKMAPYVFLRPSELAGLLWEEVDLAGRLIRISPERMKMRKDHLVPMSDQVYNILANLKKVNSSSEFVFQSLIKGEDRHIVPDSLRAGLRRLGLTKDEFTTHGFRHMASTMLYEMGYRSELVEIQLAHTERNKSKGTYNHAEYLQERIDMMQHWADKLDELKNN